MAEKGVLDRLPGALARAESLPSPPTVAVEVLRLTRDENARVDELTTVLARDPALSAKLLKLANSSSFRRGEPATSLDKATMRLGLKTVKLMALSFSLTGDLARKQDDVVFDYEGYWRRSLTMAVAARALARLLGHSFADEAFLCGLLGRLGQLVMAQGLPRDYAPLVEAAEGGLPTAELERERLGYDFHEVGAALLEAWELPALIHVTIRHWGEPPTLPEDVDPDIARLVEVMQAADLTTVVLCEPPRRGSALSRLRALVLEQHGIADEEVDEFIVGLEQDVAEMAEMLNVEVEHVSYQEIIDHARNQLVEISLGTAIDLAQTSDRAVELERENLALASQAHTDPLTGIPNRGHLDHVLERLVAERLGGSSERSLGVLMIDVDHFKRFNDTHGHAVGDAVLKQVAVGLEATTREEDIVARYGGEEFVVLLPETTFEVLRSVAERVRQRIEAGSLEHEGQSLVVTASVGGASVRRLRSSEDGARLLAAADACLYEAKGAGRNRCVCRAFDALEEKN